MAEILATTGAITTASRLAGELEKLGCLNVRVVRTPSEIASGGCSYSVSLPEESLPVLRSIINNKRFKVRKILRQITKNGEREFDDIS